MRRALRASQRLRAGEPLPRPNTNPSTNPDPSPSPSPSPNQVSLLDAELCALAIERGLTALALAQLQAAPGQGPAGQGPPGQGPAGQGPPGAAPTERRLCALGVLWNLSEACP